MKYLFLGSSKQEKTSYLEEIVKNSTEKVIVVDFNGVYHNATHENVFLDKVNPLLGEISLDDAKAINAGYTKDSHCLHHMCRHILAETNSHAQEFLVEQAVDRLVASWDPTENKNAAYLSGRMPLKRNRRHISLEKIMEELHENQKISLRAKNMHSYYSRAVIFSLISKLSRTIQEPVTIVIDDISNLFNQSNLKLWLETIDFTHLTLYFSYTKLSNFPALLMQQIDAIYIHKKEDASVLPELIPYGITSKRDLNAYKQGDVFVIPTSSSALKEEAVQ